MTTWILILIIAPLIIGVVLFVITLNDWDNPSILYIGPLFAVCWFGALMLWVGGKYFGGG